MSTANGISNVNPRPSLFSRLFRILVPCVSSNDLHSESLPEKSSNDPIPTPPIVQPPPELEISSASSPQSEILTPHTPQLLPLDETEGLTSGAVQPPGSTGDSPTSLHEKSISQHSTLPPNGTAEGDDSEGTSFTEDEDIDGLDDLEDEEEKLIMDGGAGIPIGPVCSSPILCTIPTSSHSRTRMVSQNRYYLQFLLSRLAGNVSFSTWTRPWYTAASR